jgi:hypothetical protein
MQSSAAIAGHTFTGLLGVGVVLFLVTMVVNMVA